MVRAIGIAVLGTSAGYGYAVVGEDSRTRAREHEIKRRIDAEQASLQSKILAKTKGIEAKLNAVEALLENTEITLAKTTETAKARESELHKVCEQFRNFRQQYEVLSGQFTDFRAEQEEKTKQAIVATKKADAQLFVSHLEKSLGLLRYRLIESVIKYMCDRTPLEERGKKVWETTLSELQAELTLLADLVSGYRPPKEMMTFLGDFRDILDRQVAERVKVQKSRWVAEVREVYAEIERLETRNAAIESHFQAAYVQQIEKVNGLLEKYKTALSSVHPEIKEIWSNLQMLQSEAQREKQLLMEQLEATKAAVRFPTKQPGAEYGNDFLDWVEEHCSVVLDAHDVEETDFATIVFAKPRTMGAREAIKSILEDAAIRFNLLEQPEMTRDRDKLKFILLHAKKGRMASASQKNQKFITEATIDWLLALASMGNHFRVAAPTDTGKSVFMDNLIACLQIVLDEDCEILLGDPKYPFTDWNVQPTHKGFAATRRLIEEIGELTDTRLAQATADKDAGKAIRDFKAQIIAIDELETFMDDLKLLEAEDPTKVRSKMVVLLRKGLKLGRGLSTVQKREAGKKTPRKGIKILYVTQSPLCSRIGMNKDDFENSVNVFIGGDAIATALEKEVRHYLPELKLLELKATLAEFRIAEEADESKRFYALIKTPQSAFISALPGEGVYATKLDEHKASKVLRKAGDSPENRDQKPMMICPHCGSVNSNSKGGDRRYCKDCKRTFKFREAPNLLPVALPKTSELEARKCS